MSWTRYSVVALVLAAVPMLAGSKATPASVSTKMFTNPVYKSDFADPYVIKVGKTYWAYATNTPTADVPTLHSTDLIHWKSGKDAFPAAPRWVAANIWAPDVIQRKDKRYVLYYTAKDTTSGRQCLGYALAKSPDGPFINRDSSPWFCQVSLGGDIDPAVFTDSNGKLYLLWKNDGNCCNITTYLWAQPLASDGITLEGKPVQLIHNDQAWEGNLVEAPFMWKHGGTYFLFFSANNYASPSYAVGYATCKTPLGPCTDAPNNPILFSRCKAAGPGGETIIRDDKGQTWMMYHAWLANHVNDPSVGRVLWLDRLSWKKGVPVVRGPDCARQVAPAT